MAVVTNGVQEKYEKDEVHYKCSLLECSCTFYCNNESPCRHILFKREVAYGSLNAVFDLSLFHRRYHREGGTGSATPSTSNSQDDELCDVDNFSACTVEPNTETQILTTREKYKMILPIALNLANLASNHGTTAFLEYLKTLKEFEKNVRSGKALRLSDKVTVNNSEMIKTTVSQPPVEEVHTAQELPATSGERFQFTFREKVKVRGRPKRPAKQLCSFNKSLADRKPSAHKRSSSTIHEKQPPTKKIRKCLSNVASDEEDAADSAPTCLICYSSFNSATRATVTFTPCCAQKVHKKCWKADGCPKCDDFGNE